MSGNEDSAVPVAADEADERLRLILDAAGMGLWSWDAERDELTWDAQMYRIFGVRPEGAPVDRVSFRALLHPEERDEVERVISVALSTGSYPDLEYRVVRPDGVVRWVHSRAAVHRGPDGRAGRLLGLAVDVTERKQRDEQLRQIQKMDAVGHLTAGIAHNFNNLLMAILPNVQLARTASPAALPQILDDIEAAGRRGAELVRQLMAFSRGRRPRATSLAPLATTVRQVFELCQGSFPRAITLALHDRTPPDLMCEPSSLQQALLNVLLNARDALGGRSDGRVDLAIDVVGADEAAAVLPSEGDRAARYARIVVEDNGPGMDAATQRRLFEPFFTTRPPGTGAGLGLAVSYALVRDLGGQITFRSSPGHGSAFTLWIPVVEAVPSRVPLPGPSSSAPGRRRLLVVDDEALVRRALTRILELAGHDVTAVEDGERALAAWDRPGAFDLALVDLAMPGMGGVEVRTRLLERDPAARVLFVTGYGEQGLPAGLAVPCVAKPVEPAALLSTIAALLAG